jgi:hypothetical protein
MSDFDRIKRGLTRIVQAMLAPTDYHAAWPAKVVSQSAQGLLELVPDDPRLKSINNVPIRYGVPGVTATVRPGARVMLQFEQGDPSRPIATVWESASLISVTVKADKVYIGDDTGDVRPIARTGDTVECIMPPLCQVSGSISGAPFTGLITIVDSVVGVITSGAEKGQSA